MKTGKKIINRKHIYTEAWGKSLVKVMQKRLIDPIADVVTDMKSAVDESDAKLTSIERIKGIDLNSRFYQSNGKPADDLAGRLFGRGAQ